MSRSLRSAALTLALALVTAALPAPAAAAGGPVSAPPVAAEAPAAPALERAREQVAAGDLQGAIRALVAYTGENPKDLDAARFLGDVYFRIADYKNAEATWKRIVAIRRDDRETHNRLGALYAALDRVPDAIDEFSKSLPSRGGFAGLVQINRRSGTLRLLERTMYLAAETNARDIPAQQMYGLLLRELHRPGEALAYLHRVEVARPRECSPIVDVANVLVDLGRVDEAIGSLQRCIALDATYYPALVNLGEAYLEKNDSPRSRPWLERALKVKPDGAEALVDLGYIEDGYGHWREAIDLYRRAMSADPLQPEAYIDLGYDYNDHQMYGLAEAVFLKGISVAPDEPRLSYMLAVTYNVQGKIALAREQYQRAIALGDDAVTRAARAELSLLPKG